MSEIRVTGRMPIMALRGMTVFPQQTVHFDIGRVKSALALEAAMKVDQIIFLVPQKNIMDEDPGLRGLHTVGTVAQVKQILKSQSENIRVLVTGLYRAKITDMTQLEPYMAGTVEEMQTLPAPSGLDARALCREANNLYSSYLELCDRPSQSLQLKMLNARDCGFLADAIGQNSGIEYPDKVKLLKELNDFRRLEQAVQLLRVEINMLRVEAEIQERTKAIPRFQRSELYCRNAGYLSDLLQQIHRAIR